MPDPLHDFARQRILEGGGVRSPESIESERRENARYNCRLAHRMTFGFGLVLTVAGLVVCSIGVAQWFTGDETPASGPLIWLGSGILSLVAGLSALRASRVFAIPWELATKGMLARAVVTGVKAGGKIHKQKRIRPLVTTSVLRLAVQSAGSAPYEARAVTVDQLHGNLRIGEEIAVFVDPSRPGQVFVREGQLTQWGS